MLPGYWQQTLDLGPDPDGEGDLVATLVRRGEPDHVGDHAVLLVHGFTDYFFNTETGRPLRSPAASPSTPWTCTSAGGHGARARHRTSPPTWPATTPNWSGQLMIDRRADAGAGDGD